MKQKIKFDRNYNEIEYHEIDNNGKITYSLYTYYHGIKNNPNVICRQKDSNGWIREYDKEGKIITQKNHPIYSREHQLEAMDYISNLTNITMGYLNDRNRKISPEERVEMLNRYNRELEGAARTFGVPFFSIRLEALAI